MKNTNSETRIEVLAGSTVGVSFEEAIRRANGKRLISNLEADAILQNPERRKEYRNLLWGGAWTGTIIVYEKPGITFGQQISTNWFTFEIPETYQGMRDAALVFDIRDCEGDFESLTLKKGAKIHVVKDFPRSNGWHLTDSATGVPCGESIDSSDSRARYLWRRSVAWICPLVRWGYGFDYDRRYVGAGDGPYDRRGVGVVVGSAVKQKPSNAKPTKTDAQVRSWLAVKLENYIPRIKGSNAYGSRKQLDTLCRELSKIHDELVDLTYRTYKCKSCGCTQERGCQEGCTWAKPNLCSNCEE